MLSRLGALLVLAASGCAAPSFITQPIHQDPQVFTGLSGYADRAEAATLRHEHPASWTEADLRTILGRLLIQERGGLMDPTKPPRPLFATDELARLLPGLRQAFQTARPSDWVVFVLTDTSATGPRTATSGALALVDRKLHVILANDHEPLSADAKGQQDLRANPFRPLRSPRGGLTFDPAHYVTSAGASWLGGTSGSPASELVLDYRTLLDVAQRTAPSPPSPPVASAEVDRLREEVVRLREELGRVTQRLNEQTEELARLKGRSRTP